MAKQRQSAHTAPDDANAEGTEAAPTRSGPTGSGGTTPQRTNSGSTKSEPTKKAVTPPKGRPTRARNSSGARKRAFGPVAQWVTVAVLVALIVVVLVLITDGGDFNPFNDEEQLPSQFGAPAAAAVA